MNTLSIYNLEAIPPKKHVYNSGMRKFPNNLRHYRELRGLSQESLGKKLGRQKDTISKWERGERKLKLEEAERLSHILGISIADLAGEIDNNKIYEADEPLMQRAASAIEAAAISQKQSLSLAEAMTYTVMLYNHVMAYRKNNEEVLPNEAMAALILKSVARN